MIGPWIIVSLTTVATAVGAAAAQGPASGGDQAGTAMRAETSSRYVVGPAAAEGFETSLTGAALGTGPSGGEGGKVDRAPRLTAVWKAEDLWPLTCQQAWATSGRSPAGMVGIVRTLARVSLTNRQLLFPDTRDAGLDAGKAIAEDCKEDPAGLLLAIVDKHTRRVAEAAASPRQ